MTKDKVLCAVIVLAWLNVADTLGCGCAPVPRARTFRLAAAVFTGKVLDDQPLAVTFEVGECWKGDLRQTVMLKKGSKGTSCEALFEVGATYLVYAFRPRRGGNVEESQMEVNRCPATREVQGLAKEIRALGKGRRPVKGKPIQ